MTVYDFERELQIKFGYRYPIITSSLPEAWRFAFSVLASPEFGERALVSGNKIISTGITTNLTAYSIMAERGISLHVVDSNFPSMLVDIDDIEEAIDGNTRAIYVPNHLGIPQNIVALRDLADSYHLWYIGSGAMGGNVAGDSVGCVEDVYINELKDADHAGLLVTNSSMFNSIGAQIATSRSITSRIGTFGFPARSQIEDGIKFLRSYKEQSSEKQELYQWAINSIPSTLIDIIFIPDAMQCVPEGVWCVLKKYTPVSRFDLLKKIPEYGVFQSVADMKVLPIEKHDALFNVQTIVEKSFWLPLNKEILSSFIAVLKDYIV